MTTRFARPSFEALEDRVVPVTYTWKQYAATVDFFTTTNWVGDPSSLTFDKNTIINIGDTWRDIVVNDDVTIGQLNIGTGFPSGRMFQIVQGKTLTIDHETASLNNGKSGNGYMEIDGTLEITEGKFYWWGGNINSDGEVKLTGTGEFWAQAGAQWFEPKLTLTDNAVLKAVGGTGDEALDQDVQMERNIEASGNAQINLDSPFGFVREYGKSSVIKLGGSSRLNVSSDGATVETAPVEMTNANARITITDSDYRPGTITSTTAGQLHMVGTSHLYANVVGDYWTIAVLDNSFGTAYGIIHGYLNGDHAVIDLSQKGADISFTGNFTSDSVEFKLNVDNDDGVSHVNIDGNMTCAGVQITMAAGNDAQAMTSYTWLTVDGTLSATSITLSADWYIGSIPNIYWEPEM